MGDQWNRLVEVGLDKFVRNKKWEVLLVNGQVAAIYAWLRRAIVVYRELTRGCASATSLMFLIILNADVSHLITGSRRHATFPDIKRSRVATDWYGALFGRKSGTYQSAAIHDRVMSGKVACPDFLLGDRLSIQYNLLSLKWIEPRLDYSTWPLIFKPAIFLLKFVGHRSFPLLPLSRISHAFQILALALPFFCNR